MDDFHWTSNSELKITLKNCRRAGDKYKITWYGLGPIFLHSGRYGRPLIHIKVILYIYHICLFPAVLTTTQSSPICYRSARCECIEDCASENSCLATPKCCEDYGCPQNYERTASGACVLRENCLTSPSLTTTPFIRKWLLLKIILLRCGVSRPSSQ